MDVSKIVLTDTEQAIFDRFRKTDSAELTIDEYKILIHKGLIKDSICGNSGWFSDLPEKGICSLSDKGKDLKAYQSMQRRLSRQASRRYWITTGIAVAAFLLSVVSLLWQAYTWRYEINQANATSSFSSSAPAGPKSDEAQGAPQAVQQALRSR